MKKLTVLCLATALLLNTGVHAAAPAASSSTAAGLSAFTKAQFDCLLPQALSLNNDALNGKTKKAKALAITPFLNPGILSGTNPILKRYVVVMALLAYAPDDADFSCLETPQCQLEATMAFMAYLKVTNRISRLNEVLAKKFPNGSKGNPSGLFIPDQDGEPTPESLQPYYNFHEWYLGNSTYHVLFNPDRPLAYYGAVALGNAATYLQLLGNREKKDIRCYTLSVPILKTALLMNPRFLSVYFHLSQCYGALNQGDDASASYARGDALCRQKHQMKLCDYVTGSGTIGRNEPNLDNLEERLLILRRALKTPDMAVKTRVVAFGLLIKNSPDVGEKENALKRVNTILTEPILTEILKDNEGNILLNLLGAENINTVAYEELRRKVTQAVINLEDKMLGMTWAKELGLKEALDTIATNQLSESGAPAGANVMIHVVDSEVTNTLESLFVALQGQPANTLSLENLNDQKLRQLQVRKKQLFDTGLGEGDSAYDKVVHEIQKQERARDQHFSEEQRAVKQESDLFWRQAMQVGGKAIGRSHRSGPAACAAAVCAGDSAESSTDSTTPQAESAIEHLVYDLSNYGRTLDQGVLNKLQSNINDALAALQLGKHPDNYRAGTFSTVIDSTKRTVHHCELSDSYRIYYAIIPATENALSQYVVLSISNHDTSFEGKSFTLNDESRVVFSDE